MNNFTYFDPAKIVFGKDIISRLSRYPGDSSAVTVTNGLAPDGQHPNPGMFQRAIFNQRAFRNNTLNGGGETASELFTFGYYDNTQVEGTL